MARTVFRMRFLLLLTLLTQPLFAQKSRIYTDKYAVYREALELYDKEKYSSAQQKFGDAIEVLADPVDEASINAEYYYGLCALKLFHPDAEYLLEQFIARHPESPQVRTVYMHLGRHFFQNKKWKKSIEYFQRVDLFHLTEKEVYEYHYKKGYAQFQLKDYRNAALSFNEIRNKENDYSEPATYYYSHIAYFEGSYQVALEGFEKLKASENFKSLVPYYIAQIYYLQKRYEDVVAYVPPILDTTKGKQKNELSHLVGDSYYKLKKFDIAVPYLEQFVSSVTPTREENYQMGYAYYRSGFYEKAVPFLNKAVNGKDEMAQYANYHLADCYLRQNKKDYARNAYEGAAKLDADKKVQEDAMFAYARLAYELSNNPFHEAIEALSAYLKKYPDSPRRDETYSFLINVYMTTRNYQAALDAISQIKSKDFRVQTAYQMATYNLGVDLFQKSRYSDAIKAFENVKVYPIDKRLNAESRFWIAECQYKMKNYDAAIEAYSVFQQEPGAFSSRFYNMANYNIAYAYYDKGMDELERKQNSKDNPSLTSSLYAFKKFIADPQEKDKVRLADASLRVGDLHYYRKENENAIEFYNKAYDFNSGSRDYALFQVAHCRHLLRKYDDAVVTYNRLIRDYPNSSYVQDATFEIGEVHRENSNYQKSIDQYKLFMTTYPGNQKVKKATGYIALQYYQLKNYKESERYYRILLESPNQNDIQTALDGLKNVLIAQDRESEWVALVKQYDKRGESTREIETTLWESLDRSYNANDCEKSIEKANAYLQQFPNGAYVMQARFYRAECLHSKGQRELAVSDYEFVHGIAGNPFMEVVSLRLGNFYFTAKNYEKSNTFYTTLEKVAASASNRLNAQIGMMRGNYLLKQFSFSQDYAARVLKDATVAGDLKSEAHFINGMSYLELNDLTNSKAELQKSVDITKTGWRWAEARFHMCLVTYRQGEYKKAETEIMNFVKAKPNFDYWLARSYILLSDVYLGLNDPFQAKSTLRSVIDHYKGEDEIVETAQKKYDEILERENQQNNSRKMEVEETNSTEEGGNE